MCLNISFATAFSPMASVPKRVFIERLGIYRRALTY